MRTIQRTKHAKEKSFSLLSFVRGAIFSFAFFFRHLSFMGSHFSL